MMLSNLNLSSLPECNFEVRYVDSVLLNPCAEYQRLLRMGKVAKIAANFSEYIANEPKVSYRDGRYFVLMVRTPLRHGKRATVGVTSRFAARSSTAFPKSMKLCCLLCRQAFPAN